MLSSNLTDAQERLLIALSDADYHAECARQNRTLGYWEETPREWHSIYGLGFRFPSAYRLRTLRLIEIESGMNPTARITEAGVKLLRSMGDSG